MVSGILGTGVEVDIKRDPYDILNSMSEGEQQKLLRAKEQQLQRMKNDRTNWEADWEAVSDYINPQGYKRKGRKKEDGYVSRSKIQNESCMTASDRASAGMHGGMTNQSRPWFMGIIDDEELNKSHGVKDWTQTVTDIMRRKLASTNFYSSAVMLYQQAMDFGTGAITSTPDPETLRRYKCHTAGTYYIADGVRDRVEVFLLEQDMTVMQLVERFGLERVSKSTRRAWDEDRKEQTVCVAWCCEPNPDHIPGHSNPAHFKYRAIYWEKGKTTEGLLSISGYRKFPAFVPRWKKYNDDAYGVGPGIIAIGSQKAITLLEKQRSLAHELAVQPPMRASTGMRARPKSSLPSQITYVDANESWEPAFQSTLDESGTAMEVREIEARVRRLYLEDLFLLISSDGRGDRTAYEIQQQVQERMIVLGPALESFFNEFLTPVLEDLYEALWDAGELPEPPEELDGVEFKFEYTSILAQALKAIGTVTTDRYIAALGNLANITGDSSVFDNINVDRTAEHYGDLLGTDADVMNSPEERAAIRERRAQMEQAKQAAELAGQLTQATKNLSQSSLEGQNALNAMLGQ